MKGDSPICNLALTAGLVLMLGIAPAHAQVSADPTDPLDRREALFAALKTAPADQARRLAAELDLELSRSGSPAMDLLLSRGADALAAGEFDRALAHLTALTDHAPDFAEAWHLRAVALARERRFGPALADIERALTLEPRHYRALVGLGTILAEAGQPDLAARAFQEALAIHPHDPKAREALDRLALSDDPSL